MTTVNQFYINRYNKFIATCYITSGNNDYMEIHHIVPKCMGGTDDPDNLIKLTARQHFIAHWMLWKAYMNSSLAYAFFLMNVPNKNHKGRIRKINSRTYVLLKKHKSQNQSKLNSSRWDDPEWAQKQKIILSKAASSPQEKERRSKLAKANNEKYKTKRSAEHKEKWSNQIWAKNTRQKMIENHPKTKIIIVDGIEYKKAEDVAKAFNITKSAVRYRIKSTNPEFVGWIYKPKAEAQAPAF